MANCPPSIFQWVSQSQLMPVWEEYPPPCTAYEAYYLELDQLRFMNKIGDYYQQNGKCIDDCSVNPFLESSNIHPDHDPVSAYPPQSVHEQGYQIPSLSFTNQSSLYSIPPNNNFDIEDDSETITQSPGKQSPATLKLPDLNFPQISFPVENLSSSLEQSSEISLEENKEESEVDVSDDENETIGKKRSSSTELYDGDGVMKKEDEEEVTQPKKKTKDNPGTVGGFGKGL